MNTRQKLTLGIAAIFMVTLTIVGVTYAYFVTRVETESEATANITTATIGANFHDGKLTELKNAMPGDKVYHLFAIENQGETAVSYPLYIATYTKENTGEFVHSTLTDTDKFAETSPYPEMGELTGTCYMSDAAAKAYTGKTDLGEARADCFNDTGATATYDNIKVVLYKLATGIENYTDSITNFKEVDLSYGGTAGLSAVDASKEKSDMNAKVTALKAGSSIIAGGTSNVFAPYNAGTSAVGGIRLVDNEVVEAADGSATFNYYMVEIEYVNLNLNQNVETNAFVGFKVDLQEMVAEAGE